MMRNHHSKLDMARVSCRQALVEGLKVKQTPNIDLAYNLRAPKIDTDPRIES